jgi:hypothetical protein
MHVADADTLATQVAILVEGAIIAALVRGDPGMARAAKTAARVLLTAAGVTDAGEARALKPAKRPTARKVRARK